MINISKLWGLDRSIKINRKKFRIPYAIKLDSLGIPLERWLKHEGRKATASRLKALKTWAIKVIGGEKNFSLPWIKKTFYKGYWIPNFPLFRNLVEAIRSSNFKTIRTLLCVLNSYKLYRPSIGSLESVIGITTVNIDPVVVEKISLYVDLPHVPSDVLEATETVLTNTVHSLDFGVTLRGPMGQPTEESGQPYSYFDWMESPIPTANCLGRLTVVPDKGKPRTILIGHWYLQLQTKRLSDWLRHWLWSRPEIASGDQQKMVDFIRKKSPDHWMLSIDQSNATDRLARSFQVELLVRMGCPRDFLSFLDLPFYYDPKDFGLPYVKAPKGHLYYPGNMLEMGKYTNGQPMGLYISFPLYELSHYVIAKFAIASTDSDFCICGDDIVFACKNQIQGDQVYSRYKDVIESLGGKIETTKSFNTPLVEGVGKLLYTTRHGELIDITPANGNISPLEASHETYLKTLIDRRTPLGRSILYSWLSPAEVQEYRYEDRRRFWSWLLHSEFFLSVESYNNLFKDMGRMPQVWSWDSEVPPLLRELRRGDPQNQYRFVSESILREAILTTKIKSLYKEQNHGRQE